MTRSFREKGRPSNKRRLREASKCTWKNQLKHEEAEDESDNESVVLQKKEGSEAEASEACACDYCCAICERSRQRFLEYLKEQKLKMYLAISEKI
jgi:hypothetical protein